MRTSHSSPTAAGVTVVVVEGEILLSSGRVTREGYEGGLRGSYERDHNRVRIKGDTMVIALAVLVIRLEPGVVIIAV